jgi:hypothetical protein
MRNSPPISCASESSSRKSRIFSRGIWYLDSPSSAYKPQKATLSFCVTIVRLHCCVVEGLVWRRFVYASGIAYLTWWILKVSKQTARTGNSTLGLLITAARPVPGQVSDILEGFVKAQVYRLATHVMCYFSPAFSGLGHPHIEKQRGKIL